MSVVLYGDSEKSASTLNSTSDPLNDGELFIGQWELHSAPDMLVTLLADKSCLLTIQFSHDKTNVHSSISYDVAANTHEIHRLVKGIRWVRVLVTNNSGENMSSLSLAVSYNIYGLIADNAGRLPITSDRIGTKTITYNVDGDIATINDGVTLKTFSYSGGNLTSIETANA